MKREARGITLIALVVTIIVLLILAGVAINLTIGQNGIFTRAQNAVDTSKTASDIEELQMAVVGALKIDGIIDREKLNSELPNGFIYEHGSYVNTKSKNEYKISDEGKVTVVSEELDLLEKFILGEDKNGVIISEILNSNLTFKGNEDIKPEDIVLTNLYSKGNRGCAMLKYNNKIYELETTEINGVILEENIMEYETYSVKLVYEPKGDEGKKVSYSFDGSEDNKGEWTILYDDGEYIEILSPEVIGSGYTIGNITDIDKTIEDYNNAIDNLNRECKSLVTNLNKVSVRCVGSNPLNPNSKNTEKIESEQLGENSGKLNSEDKNFEQDLARMSLNNLTAINTQYWLASCGISENEENQDIGFFVRGIQALTGMVSAEWLQGSQYEHGIRPVVEVKKSEVSILNY